jgi:hypothetical protein
MVAPELDSVLSVAVEEADRVVKLPAAAVVLPITVLLIDPLEIAVVVNADEAIVITPVASAIVADAVPSLARMLATWILSVVRSGVFKNSWSRRSEKFCDVADRATTNRSSS